MRGPPPAGTERTSPRARRLTRARPVCPHPDRRAPDVHVPDMMTRRPALLSLLSLAVAACSRSENAAPGGAGQEPLTAVKLQLDWLPEPEFGGFYAARENGDFAKEGLDVAISGGGAGVPTV